MVSVNDTPELLVADVAAWRAWLTDHHDTEPVGVRLIVAKKGTTEPTSLMIADALDEALCFGWIDGQRNGRDETTFLQKFSPRRRASTWSERNVGYVARLIEEGRMTPAGQAEIDRAKADGRWDRAYAGQKDAVVPADLQAAIDASPAAAATFATINRSSRFALIFRTEQAKRADTRANRIANFVEMLERGETLH